jgi:hypothetical protein
MNPFELRYQLLETARSMLENQYHAQVQAWEMLEKVTDGAPYPKFPSFEDILNRAMEMNKFISDNK